LRSSILIFLIFKLLFSSSCYSIYTKTGLFTPVAPNNVIGEVPRYSKCKYFDESILFDNYSSYIGCDYNKTRIENLYKRLKKAGFHFKDEKIVKHKITNKDIYVVFPRGAYVKKFNMNRIYKKYSISNVEKMFLKPKNNISFMFLNLEYIRFLPTINIYRFYDFYKRHNFNRRVLIIYNGSTSIEALYRKVNNKNIIEKRGNSFIIKVPIYISPTASLVINHKTLLLESYPKPVFIMYHGNLFIKDSKILSWDLKHNRYYPHPNIPKEKLLLIGTQRPRPYFIGLAGSKTIFLNNEIKGLGFHDTVGPFGIALVHYPKDIIFKLSSIFTFLGSTNKVTGIFIGNNIHHNMMGFYTNEAKNVVLIGNIFHDNIIYNVDPHDYSENLIIARNLLYNAKYAHGIVISRHVERSIITENFSLKNYAAGIMLDRLSNNNIVSKNLSIENGYMGITIQESDNVLVKDNYLIRNRIDGIMVRNSLRNTLKNNFSYSNGKNGMEIFVKDLKDFIYRDFLRDPYHKATSAILINNKLENNYNYNLMVKNSAAVKLIHNKLHNINFNKNYGGDLNYFVDDIVNNNGLFTLYGRGQPFISVSSDLWKLNRYAFKKAVDIIRDISLNNKEAGEILAYIYRIRNLNTLSKKELKRESSKLISQALNKLGFLILIDLRKHGYKNRKKVLESLSYIIEASILGNKNAAIDITYLPFLAKISIDDINRAYYIAV